MNTLDISIFQYLNSWAGINYFYDWAIIFRAEYLWYVVMLAVAVFPLLAFLPRFKYLKRKNTALFFQALLSATLARFVLKEVVAWFYNRPRPFEVLDGVHRLLNHEVGKAFPSGHAALSFAVAVTVYYYYPKTSILFFLAALSIGLGRISAGLHWPTDILGGAVVGIFSAWLVDFLFKKLNINKSTEN